MLRYWVCQTCKYGHVDDTKPTICPNCLEENGEWKWSATNNMGSFHTYICQNCDRTVEERQPPTYSCDVCGGKNWRIFNGY